MTGRPEGLRFAVCALTGVLLGPGVVFAQPPQPPPGAAVRAQVVPADRHDVSPALGRLPAIPPSEEGRMPLPPRSVRRGPGRILPTQVDPALQTSAATSSAATTVGHFEGVSNMNGVLPPDTNGDVGGNFYVQWVNLSFAIYDKTTGATLYGPANGRTLWQGFGGPCETRNDGDPIVLFDEHAQRWLMSQFALPNYPRAPFYQCIAISQTADPTGAYYRYQFSFNKMNDYPKFGVWNDGYYMSINQFNCSVLGCQWAGQGVAAFPRTQMLAGQPASMVYFDMVAADELGGMLPADLDGPPPPSGTPNYYVQFDDDAWGYSPDQLQIWEFKVDWGNPGASTFTKKTALPTQAFDSNLCGYSRNCIRQAGSSVRLDAISDRVMYRLQYRNFGTHQTLVTNHSVDVNGSDQAGVRWYELRIDGGTPSIRQQGTFAPDSNSRWMASAAMDQAGNIALGYNVSSSQMFPRISFTGRKSSDPLGQMTLSEGDIMIGSGAQTHTASRWGDYSLLAVDPADGCTFWFTTEYYSNTSSSGWRTHVGAFQIEGCGGGGGGVEVPPAAPSNLITTSVTSSGVDLQWSDNSSDETGFHVERCTGSGCSSFTEIATTGADATAFSDTPPAGTYSYRVRASRTGVYSTYSNTVSATVPPVTPAGTMHVASLSGSSVKAGGPNWQAVVTIRVVDAGGAAVSGAVVSGAWSAGATGAASCTTDSNGTCTVTSPKANSKNVGSITFTVNSLTHGSFTYDASANAQTSIVVNKP